MILKNLFKHSVWKNSSSQAHLSWGILTHKTQPQYFPNEIEQNQHQNERLKNVFLVFPTWKGLLRQKEDGGPLFFFFIDG